MFCFGCNSSSNHWMSAWPQLICNSEATSVWVKYFKTISFVVNACAGWRVPGRSRVCPASWQGGMLHKKKTKINTTLIKQIFQSDQSDTLVTPNAEPESSGGRLAPDGSAAASTTMLVSLPCPVWMSPTPEVRGSQDGGTQGTVLG